MSCLTTLEEQINFNKLLSLTLLYNECPCVCPYQAKAKVKSWSCNDLIPLAERESAIGDRSPERGEKEHSKGED